ncbi:alpha/beta hydrolase [Planctomycetota bacterium]|nr:alpha/beta hydrolase [Planctomycetota bacterium]
MRVPGLRTLHAGVDDLITAILVVIEQKRGFSSECPGAPPKFEHMLDRLSDAPTRVRWPERLESMQRVKVDLPAFDTTTCLEFAPAEERADTLLVYHHGLGEIPHYAVPWIWRRLAPKLRKRCDVVAVRALHHGSAQQVNADLVSNRDEFVRTLAASASVVRTVAKDLRPHYKHVVMCGVSMGGVVSLTEASREPKFDLYVPLVAGPDLRAVVLRSVFSRLLSAGYRREMAQAPWLEDFNLVPRLAADGPPIRPLLAHSDRLFDYATQSSAYAQVPRAQVSSFEGGHITGAMRFKTVTRHLERQLAAECWSKPAQLVLPVERKLEAIAV